MKCINKSLQISKICNQESFTNRKTVQWQQQKEAENKNNCLQNVHIFKHWATGPHHTHKSRLKPQVYRKGRQILYTESIFYVSTLVPPDFITTFNIYTFHKAFSMKMYLIYVRQTYICPHKVLLSKYPSKCARVVFSREGDLKFWSMTDRQCRN